MKNKVLNLLILFCFIISSCFILVACANTNTPPEESHSHNWSSTWSTSATHHWYKCRDCNEIKNKKEHIPENGTCSTCKYTLKATESKKYIITYSHHFITYGNLGNSWGFGIKDNFTKNLLQNNEIYTFDLAYGPSIIAIAVESDDGQDDVGYRVFEFSDIAIGEEETKTLSFYVTENGGNNIGSRAEISFTITCKRVALDYSPQQQTHTVNFMLPAGATYTGELTQQVVKNEYAVEPIYNCSSIDIEDNTFWVWAVDGDIIVLDISTYKITQDTLFVLIAATFE